MATLCNGEYFFECGQYITLLSLSGGAIPLSIATSPLKLPRLKIIYKPEPTNPDSLILHDLLQHQTVEGTSALGSVRCPQDSKNLVLICKGTGISQAAAMTEHCKLMSSPRRILLIWNAEGPETWFPFVDKIVSNKKELLKYLETQRDTIKDSHCIITGDPDFVYSAQSALLKLDISAASIQSDVFAYAPR